MPALALSMLVSAAPSFAQKQQVHLYTPSTQPTAKDCEFVAKANAKEVSRITQAHGQCLNNAPLPSSGAYNAAAPCSRLQCRTLHFQMEFASKTAGDINRECRARTPQQSRPPSGTSAGPIHRSDDAVAALLELDKAVGWAQDIRELAETRDRPWNFVAAKLGEILADSIRSKVIEAVGPQRLQESLDWQAFEALAGRALELDAMRTPDNHLRNVINQAAIARLQAEYASTLGDLERKLAEVDRAYDAVAGESARRFMSMPIRSFSSSTPEPGPERPVASPGSEDCAILRDTERSRSLLSADPDRWLALSRRCSGK